MSAIFAAYRQELGRIFALKAVMSTLFVAALIYAFYYPQPYRNEALRDIPIALVDLDRTSTSRELARRVDEASDVAITMALPDFATASREVFKRELSGVLVIPQYFERDLLHGRPSPISLYSDAAYFLVNSRLSSAVVGTARAFGAEVESGRLVSQGIDPVVAAGVTSPMPLTAIPLFNPQGGYATYILPGAFTLILQQTLLIAIGLLTAVSGASRGGVNEKSSDAGVAGTVLAKLAVYLTVGLILVPFYFIVIPYFYGVPRLGEVATIFTAAVPFVLSVAALGMVLGALFRSSLSMQLSVAAVGMPLFFLSGFSWPQEAVPPMLHAISLLIPGTLAITGMTRVVEMGATITDIRYEYLGLWALAVGYGLLAMMFEWRRQNRLASA